MQSDISQVLDITPFGGRPIKCLSIFIRATMLTAGPNSQKTNDQDFTKGQTRGSRSRDSVVDNAIARTSLHRRNARPSKDCHMYEGDRTPSYSF